MVGERRARDLQLGLDLPRGHVAPLPDQEEEDLQARQVGEGLERLDVFLAGLQAGERQRLHVSKSIKLRRPLLPAPGDRYPAERRARGADSLMNSSRLSFSPRAHSLFQVVRAVPSDCERELGAQVTFSVKGA